VSGEQCQCSELDAIKQRRFADFKQLELSAVVERVRTLVDVINDDLMSDEGITARDMLDWLAICGLTVSLSDSNEAFQAYIALNTGLLDECLSPEVT
jgi:hypothetical protein